MNHADQMALTAYRALDEKKGRDIRIIRISDISVIADYFVIVDGGSSSQVNALVDNVEEKMHLAGYVMKQREGRDGTWVLLDYGDVIVHVFDSENRSFYNLEHIWSDGQEWTRRLSRRNRKCRDRSPAKAGLLFCSCKTFPMPIY